MCLIIVLAFLTIPILFSLLDPDWATIFALGQLIVDAVLFPTALVMFWRAQAKPKVDLFWADGAGGVMKEVVFRQSDNDPVQMCCPTLLNSGNAVGVWYMLSIFWPGDLQARDPYRAIVGDDHNWRNTVDTGTGIYTFMSNGQIGCYPGFPLQLCTLSANLRRSKSYAPRYAVRYTIVSDWGKKQEGILQVRVEDTARAPSH